VAQIIQSSSFNPINLRANGLYIVRRPPSGFKAAVATDVIGFVGGADWGKRNQPTLVGDVRAYGRAFGPLNAASLTDVHDMAIAINVAFSQSAGGSPIEALCVAVDDGTADYATIALVDTSGSPKAGGSLTARCVGTAGNAITVNFAAGTVTNTVNVKIFAFDGADSEIYENLPSAGAGVFWASLKQAVNFGNTLRPPSKLVRFVDGVDVATAITPALGTFDLTGGLSGRSGIDSADLLGSDSSVPKTGAYSLRSQDPSPSVVVLCGNYDNTIYSSLKTLAESEGWIQLLDFSAGTSSATAKANKKTYAVDSFNVGYCWNQTYIYDSVNGLTRLLPASYTIGGRIVSLQPQESCGNKEVFGIVGTERNDPSTGDVPFSESEEGDLEQSGILFIKRGIPRNANIFGIKHGMSSLTGFNTSNLAHTRIITFLFKTVESAVGQFVEEIQTTDVDDQTRLGVETAVNSVLIEAQKNRLVDQFKVQCDLDNNSPATIAAGQLNYKTEIRPIGHARFIIWDFTYDVNAQVA